MQGRALRKKGAGQNPAERIIMKAILVGKNRELTWSDVPDPIVGAEDVLVKIEYAALNRADLMQRAGAAWLETAKQRGSSPTSSLFKVLRSCALP